MYRLKPGAASNGFGNLMVRGKKSRISPLIVRMPSQTAVDTESDLSKHVAIMSGLCETEDRISKILRGYEEDCTPNVDYDDEYFTGQRRYSLRGCSFDSGSEGSSTRVLTSLRDSLKKQFNGFLTDDCVVEMEEPSMEEFVSTIDLTSNHLRKLDEINQTILKLARESKAVQPVQQDKAAASGPNDHQYNHLMKMYTDEAMKSSKLQKVVNDQGNELQQMKTGYSILSSKSKNENELYQQTLTSLTEANQIIAQLKAEMRASEYKSRSRRTSIASSVYQMPPESLASVTSLAVEPNESNNSKIQLVIPQPGTSDETREHEAGGDDVAAKSLTPAAAENNTEERKISKKYAECKSKVIDKHLTLLEELIVQSNSQIKVALKKKSELIVQLNLDIYELCHGVYSCLCEASNSAVFLLGIDGSEKLFTLLNQCTIAWNSQAKHLKNESVNEFLKQMIDNTEKDAGNVSIEIEKFIKRKLKSKKTLLNKEIKMCAVAIQDWLLKTIVEIQGNIQSIQFCHQLQMKDCDDKKSHELHDVTNKINATLNEISATLRLLKVKDDGSVRSVKNSNNKVKECLVTPKSDEPHDLAISHVFLAQNELFSAVNTLRGNIAAQLRKLYGVHLCSSSWRIRSFNQTTKRDTMEHRPSICNFTSMEQDQLQAIKAPASDIHPTSNHLLSQNSTPKLRSQPLLPSRSKPTANQLNNYPQHYQLAQNGHNFLVTAPLYETSSECSPDQQVDQGPVGLQSSNGNPSHHQRAPMLSKRPSIITVSQIQAPQSKVNVHQRKPESFRKTTTQERMQNYFNHLQVKYSGRSQLEGVEPRSVSALSQRSVLSPNTFNAGLNVTTGGFPQPKRAPMQRIGNFAYPTRKVSEQPAELDPRGVEMTSNSGGANGSVERRPFSALSGRSLPKWSRLHNAYSKQSSSKRPHA